MFAQSSVATAALALSLLAPSIATAQASLRSQGSDRPTLVLFANGGGDSSLTDLNDAGTTSLKTGWTAGGGAGVQLNRYVAVRGTFDFAQAKGDNGTRRSPASRSIATSTAATCSCGIRPPAASRPTCWSAPAR